MDRSVDYAIVRRIVYWELMTDEALKFAVRWLGPHKSPYYGQAVSEKIRRNKSANRVMEFVTTSPTLPNITPPPAQIYSTNERNERRTGKKYATLTAAERIFVLDNDSGFVAENLGVTVRSVQNWKRRMREGR